jgi:hypothetical protein
MNSPTMSTIKSMLKSGKIASGAGLPGQAGHPMIGPFIILGVIDKYYGDRTAYPWKWEYKTIGNWARWAGYSTEKKESKVPVTKRTDLSDFFPMPVRYAAEQVNS